MTPSNTEHLALFINMYFSAILFLLSALQVCLSHAGPIWEKMKLSRTIVTKKGAACPPGVWTCSTGKRSLSEKETLSTFGCPPGVWTCSTGKRSHIAIPTQFQGTAESRLESEVNISELNKSSREISTYRKQKMFRRMLKKKIATLKVFQAAQDACPPGVWTCSTGKR